MPTSSPFERHIQSVVQAIIVALLIWIGYSTVTMREAVVKLELRQEQAAKEISEMRADLSSVRTQAVNAAAAAALAAATAASAAAQAAAVSAQTRK